MGGQNSNQQTTSSTAAATITATSSGVMHSKQRIVENFLVIWVDAKIEQSNIDVQNTLTQLHNVVNNVNIFTQLDKCIQFLNGITTEKVFVITSGSLGQQFVPKIHALQQLDTIYIFCRNQSLHAQWAKVWAKIKGVHTQIKPICEALQLDAKQCNQDSIAISFVKVGEQASDENLNQLEPFFMYTQIFKEILLKMEHDEKSIKYLAIYCRKFYNDNKSQLNIIQEFENNYRSESSIWWYTRECFTYHMLNRSLRTLEADTIINMGFFVRDLHQQIQQLHQKQVSTYFRNSFTVYRGQGLLKTDFEKLVKTKGGLMSFNNFLSTSKKREVSLNFAKGALQKTNMMGILFEMTIDPSVSSAPFASIPEVSYYKKEEEILFSMHSVFRISEITKIDNNNSLYQVNLKLTADDDQELRTLTERIRKEVGVETGWEGLGNLLFKLSEFGKADELYTVLLEQTSDESEKALYYNQLGHSKDNQADYEKAIEYHENALEIFIKTLPSNHPTLGTSYNNIGYVYMHMGEYMSALSFYEKSRKIWEKTLSPNYPALATLYNNIGLMYYYIGKHLMALPFYEKAFEIRQKILPANHPHLATSYNNIGLVYDAMEEYSKALSSHEKALDIRQKTLPPNHPDLAQSYNNIGLAYKNMGEYSIALSYYEKDLEIGQKSLPENHPDLAITYQSIGDVHMQTGQHSKALSSHEKAFEIFGKTLPPNHPRLAISYNNIGLVYMHMTEYLKALPFFEKTLEIQEKTLLPNYPDLATSYNNIGGVYKNMGDYSKALPFFEKKLEIQEKTLPENHPNLARSYSNIAEVYCAMNEHSKALSSLERALNIYQSSLPPDYTEIQKIRRSIEIVKKNLRVIGEGDDGDGNDADGDDRDDTSVMAMGQMIISMMVTENEGCEGDHANDDDDQDAGGK